MEVLDYLKDFVPYLDWAIQFLKLNWKILLIGLFFLIISYFLLDTLLFLASIERATITVKEKSRVYYPKKLRSKYLIFCEEGVFQNTDKWIVLKFGSSDIQNRLQVGKTYRVWVGGERSRLFSNYRNILKIKKEVL